MSISPLKTSRITASPSFARDISGYSFKGFAPSGIDRMAQRRGELYMLRGTVQEHQGPRGTGFQTFVTADTTQPGQVKAQVSLKGSMGFPLAKGTLSYPQRFDLATSLTSFLSRARVDQETYRKYSELIALLKQPEPCF